MSKRKRGFRGIRRVLLVAIVAVAYLALRGWDGSSWRWPAGEQTGSVEEAYAARASDHIVTLSGKVERVLSDDNEGSRHQRFIVRLPSSHTVLVAHNIDLAERVPLRRGDAVELRGEYEWNERGGVVHWTHSDPRGRHDGGWIRHQGRTYR